MHTLASLRTSRLCACVVAAIMAGGATRAAAQSVHNVLLVLNDSSPASREIGEYYALARGVPESQVVRVQVDPAGDIPRIEYERGIERPIRQWLDQHAAHDRILYIVLTKGLPVRIQGTTGKRGTVSSVDSELTLLYRKLVGAPISPDGPISNPYFLRDVPLREARPFSHERYDFYLVTRLDGFTVADVKGLIDRAARPAWSGTIVLDQRLGPTEPGDRWLEGAADSLATSFGDRVRITRDVHERDDLREVLGYYSWGSND
ncbi:MAG: TIGR03790 family protein, partial [Acidobacteria bacterium]|nr:TIGR03790 family protein [Acidobacteriota bacterium]